MLRQKRKGLRRLIVGTFDSDVARSPKLLSGNVTKFAGPLDFLQELVYIISMIKDNAVNDTVTQFIVQYEEAYVAAHIVADSRVFTTRELAEAYIASTPLPEVFWADESSRFVQDRGDAWVINEVTFGG